MRMIRIIIMITINCYEVDHVYYFEIKKLKNS
jgi:hypothetical protein